MNCCEAVVGKGLLSGFQLSQSILSIPHEDFISIRRRQPLLGVEGLAETPRDGGLEAQHTQVLRSSASLHKPVENSPHPYPSPSPCEVRATRRDNHTRLRGKDLISQRTDGKDATTIESEKLAASSDKANMSRR
jgi:hypothetical protein